MDYSHYSKNMSFLLIVSVQHSSHVCLHPRSEGHLCLPVRYTHAFPEALKKLCCGEFRCVFIHRYS